MPARPAGRGQQPATLNEARRHIKDRAGQLRRRCHHQPGLNYRQYLRSRQQQIQTHERLCGTFRHKERSLKQRLVLAALLRNAKYIVAADSKPDGLVRESVAVGGGRHLCVPGD